MTGASIDFAKERHSSSALVAGSAPEALEASSLPMSSTAVYSVS